ncbi:ZIP family metal transporter [Sphingopyxis sp.]|uniref:ZIP family metal transporter n=1 Tax=Sphingopyxis sp. TaxID=1908224 RepID=UPI001E125E80|nr:ZIP family metal transporter [Sphingopyxis sp.]MBW8295727.1 ZIP family metal transporter [Sphingopyxis sp.]
MLQLIVAFTLLGSIGALVGAALFLVFPEAMRRSLLPYLVSYAIGTLLGSAFLCLIPAGLEKASSRLFMAIMLGGFVAFFLLEMLLLQRHSLAHERGGRSSPGLMVLIGDAFHNFVDGVVIAAAFMTSTSLGITVALTVIAHEIPQEIGEFAILLDNGFSRLKAFLLNALSATAALPGAVLAYLWLGNTQSIVPFMLAISAASFVYVASVDLIPTLHRDVKRRPPVGQIVLLIAGIGTIAIVSLF